MTVIQIGGAGLAKLVGTWNYVNESKGWDEEYARYADGKYAYDSNIRKNNIRC